MIFIDMVDVLVPVFRFFIKKVLLNISAFSLFSSQEIKQAIDNNPEISHAR